MTGDNRENICVVGKSSVTDLTTGRVVQMKTDSLFSSSFLAPEALLGLEIDADRTYGGVKSGLCCSRNILPKAVTQMQKCE